MFSGVFSDTDKNAVLPMIKTTGTEGSSYLYNSRGEAGFTRTTTGGGKRRTKKRNGGCWTKKNRGGKSHRRRRSRYTRTRK